MRRLTFCCLLTAIFTIGFIGCAGTDLPTAPGDPGQTGSNGAQGRELLGVWEFYWDGSELAVTNTTERYVSLHINVKKFLKPPYCADCMQVSNISDDPVNKILSVDVTIKNPFKIEGADPRGIFLGFVPAINLANADDYTDFWNEYNGDINGFKLYGKDMHDGIFGEGAQDTETFEIKYNFTPFFFSTAVDAIYPADSLREPYLIQNQEVEGALDIDGNVERPFSVEVYDRNDDHGTVSVVCDELDLNVALEQDDDDINLFTGTVKNNSMAEPGDYEATIIAGDSETGWFLYDFITLTVSDDIGKWAITTYTLDNSGCPRDISVTFEFDTEEVSVFYPGGGSCDEISVIDGLFTTPETYYTLLDIDPMVPDFNPYPVTRLDVAVSGGVAFFTNSEEIYSDEFFTGPYSSMLVTLGTDDAGAPEYTNNGDGDANRIPPGHPSLRGVDVADDLQGNLYGFWADPDGVVNPQIYGVMYDFTRHDIQMGGLLPDAIVGETVGRITRQKDNLKAIQIGQFMFESGQLYVVENDGVNSVVEVMVFMIDFNMKITTWESLETITLGELDAVDIDVILFNPSYLPNQDSDTIAILINGPSGCYLKMIETMGFGEVEMIGSPDEPILSGTGIALEVNKDLGDIYIANDANEIAVLKWNL